MKKNLVKTITLSALLNLSVLSFGNAQATPVLEQQKPVAQVAKNETKAAFKNPAVMERKLEHTSGEGAVSLEELIKDKKAVLLDFYATWCGPCKAAMPELQKTSERLAPQGVSVVAIKVDGSSKDAEMIKTQSGIEFPWLTEGKDAIHSKHFGVTYFPTTVLLGQNGEVLFKGGPSREDQEKLKLALSQLGVSL